MASAVIVLACQFALAVVFALSVVHKASAPAQYAAFRRSLPLTLRIPERFAGAVAATVVSAEAAVSVFLVAGLASRAVLAAAFAFACILTAALTVAIVRMIATGVTEPCHCFGTTARPPGPADLARNLVLLGIGVTGTTLSIAIKPGAVEMPYPNLVMVLLAALGVFNAAVAVVILRKLSEQSERLRASIEGVANPQPIMRPAGQHIGTFEAVTIDGETLTATGLQGTTLVGFLSSTCPACAESLPGFVLRAMEAGRDQTLAVLVGPPDGMQALRNKLAGVARVVIEPAHGPVAHAFKVDGFPAFALLSDDVVVASHFALERIPESAHT